MCDAMEAVTTRQITLYMRPGCHLCEDAADLLAHLAEGFPLEIVEVNILSDIGLYERYKHSIPIVAISGGPTLAAPIHKAELLRWLK